jgi:HK97 family phage portal protein
MLNRFFEERAVSFQTVWGSGDFLELENQAGTRIDENTAFQVNAIFSAVSLISDTISTLPVDAFIRLDGQRNAFRPRPEWVTRPDIDQTKEAFYGAVIVSLLLDGNAFVRVFSNRQGQVTNMVVLNPTTVDIKRNGIGRVMYTVQGDDKGYTPEQIIHIADVVRPGHLRGVSRVEALKENFGLALALENYAARFFGQGATTQGIIEYPNKLTAQQATELQQGFDARHKGWKRAHKTGILSNGATYKPTSVGNDQAQFIDSRRMAVEDVARAFKIPSHLLNLPGTNTYASVEENNRAWVTHCLRPITQKLESAFSPLLARVEGGDTAFIRFNMDGLLRADINNRYTAYSVGQQSGFLSVNDVRRLEDLPDIDEPSANTVRVPLANVNVESATVTAQSERVDMAQRLVQVGYDPAEVLAALDLPPIAHTGLPSVQLQPTSQINETDPNSEYQVD